MAPQEVGPDLFDFGKVAADIDLRQRKEEYYRSLLKERTVAEQAFLREQEGATPQAVSEALDAQLRNQPVVGGKRIVLDAWVRLGHHARTKLLPAAIVAALPLLGIMVKEIHNNYRLEAEERSAEHSVQEIAGKRDGIAKNLASLAGDPAYSRLPALDSEAFNRELTQARVSLVALDEFFREYSSTPEIERRITVSNYQDISAQALRHGVTIDAAGQSASAAQTILKRQTTIDDLSRRIDAFRNTVDGWSGVTAIEGRAKSALEAASSALDRRDTATAQTALALLDKTSGEYNTLVGLRDRVAGVYEGIAQSGCPADAIAPAQSTYAAFKSAATSADLEAMTRAATSLEGFSKELLSAGDLRVVGGIWIYQNEDHNQKSYYLKVQLVDGNPVWLPIQDDDRRGIVTSTPMWAEEVPQEVYQAVGSDKKDNGIINNADMGDKERCSTRFMYQYTVPVAGGQFKLTSSKSRITPVNPNGDLTQDRSWRN